MACGVPATALLYGFIGHFFVPAEIRAETPAEIPIDPGGFTAYVVAQFHKLIPDDKIDVVSPLRLRVNSPRGGWGAYLDTVYDVCRRYRPGCAEAVATYIREMSTAYEMERPPTDRTSLRVIVRPSDYVAAMRDHAPDSKPLAEPLQGDLWMIGAFDLPTTVDLLDQRALEPLHLSPDEALAIGKQNMVERMRFQIGKVMTEPMNEVKTTGDTYESSLFAFPELWAPVAETMAGNLLIVVPSTDVVIFADGRKPGAAEQLADDARFVMKRANRPFSADLFRWSPDGWVPLPAAGDKRP